MKNKLLLSFVLLLTATMNAQTSIVDFEDDGGGLLDTNPTVEWVGDPNLPVVTKVANPSIGGLNTSANSVRFVETSGSNMGNSLQFAFDGSTAKTGHSLSGTNKFVKFLVYSVDQTSFNILLELGTGGTPHFSMEKAVTVTLNTWTEVVFDFSGTTGSPNDSSATINNDAGWNSNIRFHFNNGSAGTGDTYYIDEYVIQTTQPSFTSSADGDWNLPANWNTAYAPDQEEGNVTIASDITITDDISVNNLTINAGESLDITGNLTNNTTTIGSGASLKVSGTSTGNVTYNRNLATTNWYLVSSPVVGQGIANFYTNETPALGTGTGNAQNVAIATYDNSQTLTTDRYVYYTEGQVDGEDGDDTTDNFGNGIGYSVKLQSSQDISFTGTVRTDNAGVSVTLAQGGAMGNNINLLGNPYLAFINSTTFINAESTNLESTFWMWNGSSYDTRTTGTHPNFMIAPAQGFFVEAKTTNAVTFTEANQSHTTDNFQKSTNTRPEIKLNLSNGPKNSKTELFYIDGTTTGFDNGFDGKMFGGVSHDFAVYTDLVSNSVGTKYAVQSLPNTDFENMIVPLGVITNTGEITFSVEALNLPSDIKVFLEDRNTNTFTRLDQANSKYTVSLNETTNEIGRFYLHTKSSVLNIDTNKLENVSIYKTNNSTLRVTGLSDTNSNVKLFNILGKQVMNTSFKSNGVSNISLPKLATGVYIVQLETEKGKLNKKIILE